MRGFPNDVLEDIRRALENEKGEVARRIEEISAQDPYRDPDRANDNAASDMEASEESSHDRYAAMVDEMKLRLASLDGALDRIAKGSYGYCERCGAMIDTDRLSVVPTATLCLSCEKKREK